MKKNRTIPFGYMMRNGEIQPEPTESKAVQDIFQAYLNGSSLLAIANWMSSQEISYNGINTMWNKNMIKRILENEKYLGTNGYPVIIDEGTYCTANAQKKMKSDRFTEISEELKAIRSLTYCTECGHRLSRIGGNTRSEKWDCRNPECARFSHRITDQMLIGVILNTLNTVIANPDLIDANSEISSYTPSIEVTRQQNEINRLMDNLDIDFEIAKEEICKLAELKYDCCTYSDKPRKTTQLRVVLANYEQLNTLDIGLLKSCILRISVSHFCIVEIEFINGVTIKNIIERKIQNDHSAQRQDNSCKAADCGKQR
ncbi:recombinase family protein [Ruminococcus sp.]|uniref:recombinase family protein n=1 Tax=Ruminococcus sp. TaxID=41978 RepID=UPI0025D68CF4|nr:recombinase family protein [Ruminococcus sp.]